jgi:hypothetical protein
MAQLSNADETKSVITKAERSAKWTNHFEELVAKVGKSAMAYRKLHIDGARSKGGTHARMMYVVIGMAPLSGALSSIGMVMYPSQSVNGISIAGIVLSCITGICTAIVKQTKAEHISVLHRATSSRYASLESSIRRQLALPRKARKNCVQYVKLITETFEDIFKDAPFVPEHLMKAYELKTGFSPEGPTESFSVNDNSSESTTVIIDLRDQQNQQRSERDLKSPSGEPKDADSLVGRDNRSKNFVLPHSSP